MIFKLINDSLALCESEHCVVDVFSKPEHLGKKINRYSADQLFNLIRTSQRIIATTILGKDNKVASNIFMHPYFVIKMRMKYGCSYGNVSFNCKPSTGVL